MEQINARDPYFHVKFRFSITVKLKIGGDLLGVHVRERRDPHWREVLLADGVRREVLCIDLDFRGESRACA